MKTMITTEEQQYNDALREYSQRVVLSFRSTTVCVNDVEYKELPETYKHALIDTLLGVSVIHQFYDSCPDCFEWMLSTLIVNFGNNESGTIKLII